MNLFIGLTMLILGGLSAGSSYVPLKGVKGWAWESGWAVQGIVAWLLLPLLLALLATPHLFAVLHATPMGTLTATYAFGFLWGLGGLAWGMAVRYIGLALGFSIATGFLSSLGTLVPIIAEGQLNTTLSTASGRVTIAGIALSLIGIVICGRAGWLRDKDQKSNTVFNFKKGIAIALAAGILGACFAFGIAAGDPIKQNAIAAGAAPQYASFPIFFVELLGGITVNLAYCIFMNRRNRTFNDYRQAADIKTLKANYAFSALVGALWYLQFVFYGMAGFYMGPYSFANWSIHMSFMVVASNLWGYHYKEWANTSRAPIRWNNIGIAVLVISGIVMGIAQAVA
ncbi:L-rhamnose/proton symporter RhaT [Puia sp.]|jgi:L-rhamnose-H+ transport protein|uniref:L-rhamnose/proton symporter RhaT n=1 Tax=Puia sp. TaxID=2045100 RepID=UPI002F3EC993